jgi:Zn-finger nucleic acid-binding protein
VESLTKSLNAPQSPNHRHDDDDDDDRYKYGKVDKYGQPVKKSKAKSLLGDLFDFG